ncbi:MAG: cytochrome biosis protein [Firmicutes bacterium]|nr:cytochrome biosis protein [Bacillota bacterium]
MVVTAYYHDMVIDPQSQQPTNASFDVKNPVFMVEFVDPKTGAKVGRAGLPVLSNAQPVYEGPLFLQVEKVDTRWYSAMKLHRDRTTPYMFLGLSIVMLGMMITFFIFHWQVWVRAEDGKLLLGARAAKNKFGLKQEFKRLLGAPNGEGTIS